MSVVGIFGGTFDPIHRGHIEIARYVHRTLELDHVRFVLSAQPPHRRPTIASTADRAHMLELAIAGEPGFVADPREQQRRGPSYTIWTLRSMRGERPTQPLALIVGMDAFQSLNTWYCWEQILALCHLIVLPRPGWTSSDKHVDWYRDTISSDPSELDRASAGKVYACDAPLIDVSASAVRRKIQDGEDVSADLPEAVWGYIRKHGLYDYSKSIEHRNMQSEQLKDLALAAMDDMKGKDVRVMDVRELTDITDYMVVVSGSSDRHVKAIADKIVDTLREQNLRPLGVEGREHSNWVLLDFGDLVIHVMHPEARRFYDLEGLWSEQVKQMLLERRERHSE